MRRFADWEHDFVRLAYPTEQAKDIAEVLGRSVGTLFGYASRHGISTPGRVAPDNVGLTPEERAAKNDYRAREKKRSLGKCSDCVNQATKGVFCDDCRKKRKLKRDAERAGLREEKKCLDCHKEIDDTRFVRCSFCLERHNERRNSTYYNRKDGGLCVLCGIVAAVDGKVHCGNCTIISKQKERRIRKGLKSAAYKAYGGFICACCGETNRLFLTIDHVCGDGSKHRKEVMGTRRNPASSRKLYGWLRANNYPTGFQILCFNCNMGKNLNGNVCPHADTSNEDSKIDWLWKLSS